MRPAADDGRGRELRRDRVTTFLAAHPGPWTTGNLAIAIGMHGSTLDRVLAGLAEEGAVLSTKRLGLMAGPSLFPRSPDAAARWSATLGAVAEPYLADAVFAREAPVEFAVVAGTRLLLLARYERETGLVIAGTDGGAAEAGEASIDRASASPIRTLRGRLVLGTRPGAVQAPTAELRATAQRVQRALARTYPLVGGPSGEPATIARVPTTPMPNARRPSA